ncbi:hypothetical protein LOC68_09425 [Blastopirellula sp. JC732]|uniref:VWFA domain-containing protein n=1 Tax=Blastopirellula sediminis TaxID=2894196 RepID=A0A9X1SG61_9BACT|nr:hypothetical protein [Blastopirellula sediminis]MCC9608606.1 hypothetical protein [Blastopirellula sediminis]MCC9628617.1 hypothetical protein [Blastopirellula sediminis]
MPKVKSPNKPLATVNVFPQSDGSIDVEACFMPDPDLLAGEGSSRAVLALDASRSIKAAYGDSGPFGGGSPNYVQAVARKIGEILSDTTKDGKVSMMYWAMGLGEETEVIGSFDAAGCQKANISGPKRNWGKGTKLLPVIKSIVDNDFAQADWVMGVIITDGIIEDEQDCISYCLQLGEGLKQQVEAGQRRKHSLKLVLIGIGEEVDVGQLERFDDMFEETALASDIDLWSSGVAADMQDEDDILGVVFGELMSEEVIVADNGRVLDDKGTEVSSFSDGLPGKFRFKLPAGAKGFKVSTAKGEVAQDISEALAGG